jgi:hypothetical protein
MTVATTLKKVLRTGAVIKSPADEADLLGPCPAAHQTVQRRVRISRTAHRRGDPPNGGAHVAPGDV